MPSAPRKLSLCLAVALAALAGASSAAQASLTWVVHGHGFGHGVGMSQYGAYGYAKHGKSYRFILSHYYTGTTLGTLASPRVVRVLLDISGGDVGFSGATSACGQTLNPGRDYKAHRVGDSVRLRSSGGKPLANCGRKLRAAGSGGKIDIAGVGTYRGALETVPTESQSGSLNVVNALSVNQYVKGVIPNESPASWPMAALKAQAVAARSYGLSVQVGGNGFDLYDTTSSQVYKGLESETARSDEAAEETRSQVVEYQGKIAQTYFSACSGGHTESVQNVFFGPTIPYLVGVPDPYDYYCPLHSWTLRFSGPEMSSKLGAYLDGHLKQIVVTQHGSSPRILWARLYGTGGVTKIRGDQLESALGAYTSWMTFQKVVH
ncbi:MAG TPA: SpoIID/LytB domain-containing protein [Solirubrobacterales bacterium]|jgi:stage II sporulation protein D|nr:SpoIID/LytB domain-containing protein [Solirubrobacterales bacterium]